MNLMDKLLLLLQSAAPSPAGVLSAERFDELRAEALKELRDISIASFEALTEGGG